MPSDMREANRKIYRLHAEVCKALAHPVRLEILDVLRGGPRSPTELAELIGITRTSLSQHLAVMRGKGLLRRVRVGRTTNYMVTDARLLRAGGELAERALGR